MDQSRWNFFLFGALKTNRRFFFARKISVSNKKTLFNEQVDNYRYMNIPYLSENSSESYDKFPTERVYSLHDWYATRKTSNLSEICQKFLTKW